MKAAVFHKIGDISVDNVDDPKIEEPDDIILKVTSTAICGSDLHIYNGFMPQLKDEVLGHEFMGVVEEVGPTVTRVKKGVGLWFRLRSPAASVFIVHRVTILAVFIRIPRCTARRVTC